MCYWKQWSWCRTKIRNLLKLGTPLDAAISVGLSRKDPWKLARTFATQLGMPNQWLKGQGFVSVKELWVNIHYPATARAAYMNRPVRTHMAGVVGAGEKNPRLPD